MNADVKFDLIVTIVNKGSSHPILKATQKAGAEGGTILIGRGTGIREKKTLFGIPIEPEKDILLTIVSQEISQKVLDAVVEAGGLDQPGAGISFVIDLKKVAGICHLCNLENSFSTQE